MWLQCRENSEAPPDCTLSLQLLELCPETLLFGLRVARYFEITQTLCIHYSLPHVLLSVKVHYKKLVIIGYSFTFFFCRME